MAAVDPVCIGSDHYGLSPAQRKPPVNGALRS